MLAVARVAPRTSRPRQRGFSVSAGTILRAPKASAAATGRLTKKIRRQSTSCVSTPPARTPSAAPAPPTAPQAASAFARAGPWKVLVMIEREAGEEHAAATEQVGGAAPEQEQAAEDERVGGDRPADRRARDVQVAGELRHRDVHGRDVEDHHQLRDQEQRQEPLRHLLLVASGLMRSAVAVMHRRLLL